MIDKIFTSFDLNKNDVLNIYSYGSRVYGTYNEKSDYDFIVIVKNNSIKNEFALENNNISLHIFNISSFQKALEQHKIFALECFFLPKELLLQEKHIFDFKLNLLKLRKSVSEKSSHSWVKAKKKFIVEKDHDVYKAKKSLFHSFRITDFGIQIAKYKTIQNYSSLNNLWEEILNNPSVDWENYNKKYKEKHNNLLTEFRKLAPKD